MSDPEGRTIDHSPVSLIGEEGEQVAHNMRGIMSGSLAVEAAGPAFSLVEGNLRVTVDKDTFELLKSGPSKNENQVTTEDLVDAEGLE